MNLSIELIGINESLIEIACNTNLRNIENSLFDSQ